MSEMAERLFWVFGRRAQTEPLEQVGVVKASGEAVAYVYALMNYNERPWRDLCVVARDSFYGVRGSVDEPSFVEQPAR